ncbi:MAG: hypothetical protein GX846_05405, partial [Deltaproteobacteria bacterium]|nr:hypothetical protein [Deltaproteobacteria bacterium]
TGQVWNANKQKFNPSDNTWTTVTDTSAFDHRKMRFLNGTVFADMDLSEALVPVVSIDNYTGERTSRMNERNMTVDSRGTIYFTGGLGDVTAGIVAFGPPTGDLNGSGDVDLNDAILAAKILVGSGNAPDSIGDVSGDFKTGLAEMIFIAKLGFNTPLLAAG